uniref:Uncharacterized protein n=1 Tax=Tanacetum cinerariifolium TaxID=118510 RepID=A0A6L2KPU6_TANCI|nr:hypothetical protein [Tanacetum cinerariifolium]
MHTSRDDYSINTLRFVSAKEETQIYDAILLESLTSPKIKETQAYQTYLGQSNRVKRPAKKSTKTPARGVVIRETLEMSLTKKEKVDVTYGKGIKILSQVALTKDARFKEVRKKSMRDFHKTHPSGSGTVTKTAPSVAKIKPFATSEGTGVKPRVPNVAEEESSENSDDDKTQSDNELESDSEHETNESESGLESDHHESDENEEEDDDEDEANITNKAEGDEDEEMDYTTSQLYDDVDIRLNEPVDTDEGFVQEEGTDVVMTNVQQGNENLEILQVIEYAHVTLSTVPQKLKVLITNTSHLSDLATKFLNFSDVPHVDYEIVSPLYVHVHHEVPSQQTPTLLTVPVSVILDSSPVLSTVIPQSLPFFIPPAQQSSPTPPPITEAINPQSALPNFASIMPKEVSNFAPPVIQSMITVTVTEFKLKKILIDKMDKSESYLAAPENRDCYEGLKKSFDIDKTYFSTYGKVYSLKRSQKHKDIDEDPSVGSDRGLKKRKTRKDAEPSTGPKSKESQSSSSKGDKSKSKSSGKSIQSEEPKFEVADSDMPHDQEENLDNDDEPKEKVASKRDWEQRKTFYAYARGMQSKHDVYSTKRILAVTQVEIKEGDFPRLHINDIEDMLLLVAHNQLTNLLGDNVSDFTIALRMFTRSLVIHKRVEDLLLEVESERNRLMHSNELYKFSDGTLTRLQTSLGDITNNIRMEYLPKRRRSTLEKNRANIMIKAIDKQLKERRMMRSLEKIVGGRDYETDLWLLQRTI